MENEAWFPEYCLACIIRLAVQKKLQVALVTRR